METCGTSPLEWLEWVESLEKDGNFENFVFADGKTTQAGNFRFFEERGNYCCDFGANLIQSRALDRGGVGMVLDRQDACQVGRSQEKNKK